MSRSIHLHLHPHPHIHEQCIPNFDMNTHELSESDSNQRSTKRRKIQLACTQCRERKVRCDGERPVCGTCGRRGKADACVYGHDEIPTLQYVHQRSQERLPLTLWYRHVRDVENRLKQLEAQTHRQISQIGTATGKIKLTPPRMTVLSVWAHR
jgi:hypothetical protein